MIAAARELGIAAVAAISGLPGVGDHAQGIGVLSKSDLDAPTLDALMNDLVAEHRYSTARFCVSPSGLTQPIHCRSSGGMKTRNC